MSIQRLKDKLQRIDKHGFDFTVPTEQLYLYKDIIEKDGKVCIEIAEETITVREVRKFPWFRKERFFEAVGLDDLDDDELQVGRWLTCLSIARNKEELEARKNLR